ncbi:zinc-binding dehydrogenase [Archangium primigenium]|uniref:zinc-binding dehydrogenase n=1 Tax=[Archangium] primigenium TaxID=2792470 RepID=UPI0019573B49|nr:zinc-binding dehydrogenase [Archangium primigenium]MBM7116626.1 zinc-binding dehydrogenase [Archangium primigenium]
MFAARFIPGQKTLSSQDVPRPQAGPRDVVLRIRAAGVCHSDLHVLESDIPISSHPFTMGHEACGELVEVGPEVTGDFTLGALYVVHGPNPCGQCELCTQGQDNLCGAPGRDLVGLGADGAYAEYLKVPARSVIAVPAGIAPEVAAIATDAVLTPYHALKTLGGVKPGTSVLVLGLGGLGLNGVQVARALGARIVASDLRAENLATAERLGAHETVLAPELEQRLAGRAFDVVVDFVGAEGTFAPAQRLVRRGGTVVLVGLHTLQLGLSSVALINQQTRVQGAFWGTHQELKEVLQLIAEGHLQPQVETGRLRDVGHWLEKLKTGQVRSRVALLPDAD